MRLRGQEEAPIELLIGVTVLTFVLIIAYYVYENASSQQCVEKIKATSAELASVISQVAQGGPGTTRYFSADFSCEDTSTRISYVIIGKGNKQTCRSLFGRPDCYMLYVFGNVSGNLQLVHAEVLQNVFSPPKMDVGGSTLELTCDYNTLIKGQCGRDMEMPARIYSMRISKQADGSVLISGVD